MAALRIESFHRIRFAPFQEGAASIGNQRMMNALHRRAKTIFELREAKQESTESGGAGRHLTHAGRNRCRHDRVRQSQPKVFSAFGSLRSV
jgi:hypothetical protein